MTNSAQLINKNYVIGFATEFYTKNCDFTFFYSDKPADFFKEQNNISIGFFTYNLKNRFENLHSTLSPTINFPETFCMHPQGEISLSNLHIETIPPTEKLLLKPRLSKEQYLQQVAKLKEHIQQGDCYEINFCTEWYAENVNINPLQVFKQLFQLTRAPFSCFVKHGQKYLLCASPERFLKREGNRLFSQPIKGTRPRGNTAAHDELLKSELLSSIKEKSENAMITDLVRNDLSLIAAKGSEQVDELFGVYSFETVHQLISTISCKQRENVTFEEILRATFPMGSMTGAPKIRSMQLIDEYEPMNRGLFSGSVGYMLPNGDFDFNVIIRSIQYDAESAYLSVMAGSAITALCNAEEEYAECQLKIQALLQALNAEIAHE